MTPDEVAAYHHEMQELQMIRRSYQHDVSVRQQAYKEGASVAREIALVDLVKLTDALKHLDFVTLKRLPKSQAVEDDMALIWQLHDDLEKTLLNGGDQ